MLTTDAHAAFDSIETAIQAIAEGKPVVVTDDENRENEGDLLFAASKATPELVNQMVRFARGLICVPMTPPHLARLGLGRMVERNTESHKTDFTISVDAAEGITTGISAFDRARTIRLLADPATRPDELVQPGHLFPLRAKPGGVLERAGHTEAAVDLTSLAGLHPSGVICEILNEDGTMARLPELVEFKRRHGLPMVSIASLIEYRLRRESLVERVARQPFASEFGDFELQVFRGRLDGRHHLAFVLGNLGPEPTLVRVHGQNLLGDVFRARDLEGRHSLAAAFEKIAREGRGVLLYLEQADGGLDALLRLEAAGARTAAPSPGKAEPSCPPLQFREYGIGAQILVALGLRKIRLLSGKTRKVVGLDGYGLEIVEQAPL